MGQAKRKALLRQAAQMETGCPVITGVVPAKTGVLPEMSAIISRVASAMRRLAVAASGNFGGDCYTHTSLGQALLKDALVQTM